MAETKQDDEKKPLKLSRPGRLELKKTVETGTVKQSFSHGRSKQVTVEVKRKRTFTRGKDDGMTEIVQDSAQKASELAFRSSSPGLSSAERAARQRALEGASRTSTDDLPADAEEMADDAAADARAAAEAAFAAPESEPEEYPAAPEAGETREVDEQDEAVASESATPDDDSAAVTAEAPAEDEAPPADAGAEAGTEVEDDRERAMARKRAEADDLARQLAESQLNVRMKPSTKVAPQPATPAPAAPAATAEEEEDDAARERRRRSKVEAKKPSPAKKGEARRREGKLTITRALIEGDGDGERARSLASVRRARERQRQRELESGPREHRKFSREVRVPEAITVQELANRMAEKGADVVKALMKMGVMATINQTVDQDTAELIVTEFGHRIRRVSDADVEVGLEGVEDDPATLVARAPVVTIMGHVDHGKTSLLDALRETDVAGREAGGITQHIGAYQVTLSGGDRITFLDTPGHAAFTAMRSRGANATDVVVLVVAADDGIQPQTIEAISHARAAEVPIIVAINKIDTKGADPDRVRQELLQHEIVVEEMGGEVLAIEVSAKEKTNLDKLEEAILLQAELMELRANPNRPAQGVVVEAKLERGRGAVATVLVQRGTLRVGDVFVAGAEYGRVRALINDRGENVEAAGPSEPVEVLGLNGAPQAGDEFSVVEDDARARDIVAYRQRTIRGSQQVARGSVQELFSKIQAGVAKELPVVIKADVQGSAEAIQGMLDRLSTDEVAVRVLLAGAGAISESDITLAKASDGMIIAFNVRAGAQARTMAERDGIDIRYYSIIYNIEDDVRGMLSGMLAPERRETFLGYAEILEVFRITKVGNIAGCRVTEGVVRRGAGVRLLRDNVVIHEGTLSTLKRFKDEVKEVRSGMECGMAFENYQDLKVGDRIECFEVEEVQRVL